MLSTHAFFKFPHDLYMYICMYSALLMVSLFLGNLHLDVCLKDGSMNPVNRRILVVRLAEEEPIIGYL